jgi:hypothetical protein
MNGAYMLVVDKPKFTSLQNIADIDVHPVAAADALQPAAGIMPTAPSAGAGARAVTGSVSRHLLFPQDDFA